MSKVLDCDPEVNEFDLHLRYYICSRTNTFGKGMNPLILQAMDLTVSLLFIYVEGIIEIFLF